MPRTVRVRLTALYGCLFVASGAALLAITYGLVESSLSGLRVSGGPARAADVAGQVHASAPVADSARAGQAAVLHELVVQSGIALAVMIIISIGLGWLMAGRTLRPLRVMTAATRKISERNLHERLTLAGPRDEVTDLADTINGLLARLEAAFDSQRRFVANASHELRTPIMLTQTLVQVALTDPAITLASLRAACQDVLVTCKEQDQLIQALLTLARSQRGIDHREPMDLASIAGHVLHARQHVAAAAGVRIAAALGPAEVAGDPRLTEILIANLVENAIRHNVPGGDLRIVTSVRVVTVTNTGPHVPADQVARLLQPFQHLDARRGQHEGLGLGLSIVTAIATAHGAELSVCPRPGGGLAIKVRFPAGC